jgi:hypothetical protein
MLSRLATDATDAIVDIVDIARRLPDRTALNFGISRVRRRTNSPHRADHLSCTDYTS